MDTAAGLFLAREKHSHKQHRYMCQRQLSWARFRAKVFDDGGVEKKGGSGSKVVHCKGNSVCGSASYLCMYACVWWNLSHWEKSPRLSGVFRTPRPTTRTACAVGSAHSRSHSSSRDLSSTDLWSRKALLLELNFKVKSDVYMVPPILPRRRQNFFGSD